MTSPNSSVTLPVSLPVQELPAWVDRMIGPSEPLSVDQGMIDRFADLTGDYQWVHVDTARAEREMGGTIAHGYLTLSLVPRFTAMLLRIEGVEHALNYGSDRIRFPEPLRAGAAIRGNLRVLSLTPSARGDLLRCEISLSSDGKLRPVCVAETLTMLIRGGGELG